MTIMAFPGGEPVRGGNLRRLLDRADDPEPAIPDTRAIRILHANGWNDLLCNCGHHETGHARRRGHCQDTDSYGAPCRCPSFELADYGSEVQAILNGRNKTTPPTA